MQVHLTNEEIQEVEALTEGWMAGLRLAALTLKGQPDTANLLQRLRQNRDILNFLLDEVVQQQPESVRTFLLETSIVNFLCASLCNQMTQRTDSQKMLEYLEQANLFIDPLDAGHREYRYQTLFAEALRYRLEQTPSIKSTELHERASQWFEEHGNLHEALDHAIKARAWEHAADVMESLLLQGIWYLYRLDIQRGLQQLPSQVISAHPHLCVAYGRLLLLGGQSDADRWLHMAEKRLSLSHSGLLPGEPGKHLLPEGQKQEIIEREIMALRALQAGFYGEEQTARELSQKALRLLPDQACETRAFVSFANAHIALFSGQSREAFQHALQAGSCFQAAGNVPGQLTILSVAALFSHMQGHLHEAWQLSQQAIEGAAQQGNMPFSGMMLAYFCQADILREWNQLDAALDRVRKELEVSEQTGVVLYMDLGYLVLMRIHLARGELDAAYNAFQATMRQPLMIHNPYRQTWLTIGDQVRFWLKRGALSFATHWAEQLAHQKRSPSPFAREREDIACARIWLHQQQPISTLNILEPLVPQAREGGRFLHVIEMLLLQAQAYHLCHQEEQALDVLSQAVRLAEPEGYIRCFVDEGVLIETLLAKLQTQHQLPEQASYLDTLRATFSQEQKEEERIRGGEDGQHHYAPSLIQEGILTPLSERELDVLRLLAQGTSNQEIAQRLVITVYTVKRHVSNILLKLEATNRTEAVIRAQELGLISPARERMS